MSQCIYIHICAHELRPVEGAAQLRTIEIERAVAGKEVDGRRAFVDDLAKVGTHAAIEVDRRLQEVLVPLATACAAGPNVGGICRKVVDLCAESRSCGGECGVKGRTEASTVHGVALAAGSCVSKLALWRAGLLFWWQPIPPAWPCCWVRMSAPTGSEARTGPFSGHITRLEPSIDHAQVGCFCVIDHAGMRKIVDHAHARATDHAAKTDVWTGSKL